MLIRARWCRKDRSMTAIPTMKVFLAIPCTVPKLSHLTTYYHRPYTKTKYQIKAQAYILIHMAPCTQIILPFPYHHVPSQSDPSKYAQCPQFFPP